MNEKNNMDHLLTDLVNEELKESPKIYGKINFEGVEKDITIEFMNPKVINKEGMIYTRSLSDVKVTIGDLVLNNDIIDKIDIIAAIDDIDIEGKIIFTDKSVKEFVIISGNYTSRLGCISVDFLGEDNIACGPDIIIKLGNVRFGNIQGIHIEIGDFGIITNLQMTEI